MYENKILTPQEILELSKTEDGKRIIFSFFMSARVAYGMQRVFEILEITPPDGIQQQCCDAMYEAIFKESIDKIMAWCYQFTQWYQQEYHSGRA